MPEGLGTKNDRAGEAQRKFTGPTVCLHIWICASLAPERLDGFSSYSVLRSLYSIRLCAVDMKRFFCSPQRPVRF